MSSKFILAIAFGSAAMLGLGFSTLLKPVVDSKALIQQFNESPAHLRELASESRIKQPRISGKMRGDQISRYFFELQFVNPSLESEQNKAAQKIAVRVRALKDVPAGLRFKWSFSESVNILSSPDLVEGLLPGLQAGESYQLEIDVEGFDRLSQQFADLVVSGELQGFKVARNLILPSRPEDTLEYAIHQSATNQLAVDQSELESSTNSNSNQSNNRYLKTSDGAPQQPASPSLNVNELKKRFSPENVIR